MCTCLYVFMTLEQLEIELSAVNEAILNVLQSGKDWEWSSQTGTKRVSRVDLPELRKHRNYLMSEIQNIEQGGARAVRGVPGW